MRLPVALEDAWIALLALPSARGELAGYTGTAVLEEADDDVHVAVFRLHGVTGSAAATARLTTALAPASDGTSIAFELALHPGPGADIGHDALLAALYEQVPAALAAGKAAAVREQAPAPSPAIAPRDEPPAWSETVEWVDPTEPAPSRPAAPASRNAKVALVAAGAAAALIAARALRKGS